MLMPHGALNLYELRRGVARKKVWNSVLGRFVFHAVKGLAVASNHEADQLRVLARIPPVAVVGVGADAGGAPRPPKSIGEPIRLLALSRIAPKKRIDLAVGALAELRARGESATLTVAGTGSPEMMSELQELASVLGVSSHVAFVGHVSGSEKAALLASADVFLAPSEDENFGISVAEALVAGVPTVSSDGVDAAGFVAHAANRVVAQPTPVSIADEVQVLADMYRDAKVPADLRELAVRAYSWDVVAGRWRVVIGADPETDFVRGGAYR